MFSPLKRGDGDASFLFWRGMAWCEGDMKNSDTGKSCCFRCRSFGMGKPERCYLFSPRFPKVWLNPMVKNGAHTLTDLLEPYTGVPLIYVEIFSPNMFCAREYPPFSSI